MTQTPEPQSIFGRSRFRDDRDRPQRLPPAQPRQHEQPIYYVPDFWRAMDTLNSRFAPFSEAETVRRATLRGSLAVSEILERAIVGLDAALKAARQEGPQVLQDVLLEHATKFRGLGARIDDVRERLNKLDKFKRHTTILVASEHWSRRLADRAESTSDRFERPLCGAVSDLLSLVRNGQTGAELAAKTLMQGVTAYIDQFEKLFREAAKITQPEDRRQLVSLLSRIREDRFLSGRRILQVGIFQSDLAERALRPEGWYAIVKRTVQEIPYLDHRDLELDAIHTLYPGVFTPYAKDAKIPKSPRAMARVAILFEAHGTRNAEEQSIVQGLRWREKLVRHDSRNHDAIDHLCRGFSTRSLEALDAVHIPGPVMHQALELTDALIARYRTSSRFRFGALATEILAAVRDSNDQQPREWAYQIVDQRIQNTQERLLEARKLVAQRNAETARRQAHAVLLLRAQPDKDETST